MKRISCKPPGTQKILVCFLACFPFQNSSSDICPISSHSTPVPLSFVLEKQDAHSHRDGVKGSFPSVLACHRGGLRPREHGDPDQSFI